MLTVNRFVFMTGLLQRLIMTVSLQKRAICQFSQRNVTIFLLKNENLKINQSSKYNEFNTLYVFYASA